jgi:AcrR family transcriptional regulator
MLDSADEDVPAAVDAEALDRRGRRRLGTIEEILDAAVAVMAEDGVAALSLSEVARRVGMRQPSLYKYFPSKPAVYDALFARGARDILAAVEAASASSEPGLPALRAMVEAMLRWGLAHRELNQLLFSREVPGFAPSPEAYAPAIAMVAQLRRVVDAAVDRGELHPGAATEDGLNLLSVLVAGIMAQQLANQPDTDFESGRFTRLTPRLMHMYTDAFAPSAPPSRTARTTR